MRQIVFLRGKVHVGIRERSTFHMLTLIMGPVGLLNSLGLTEDRISIPYMIGLPLIICIRQFIKLPLILL